MSTGYKGFLLLKSDDDNSIVYGGTYQELVAKFEDGSALLQMNEIKRKSKRDCKKVDGQNNYKYQTICWIGERITSP